MALVVLYNGIWAASHWYISFSIVLNFVVLIIAICVAVLYRFFFAKRDLLKGDEEQIDAA
jgi:hypothetical protein